MKRLVLGFCVLVLAGFILAQVTEKQKWDDFNVLTNKIEGVQDNIQHVFNVIAQINDLEIEILNDPERKAEVKKLIDLHPEWAVTDITSYLTKLKNLAAYLEINELVEIEGEQ